MSIENKYKIKIKIKKLGLMSVMIKNITLKNQINSHGYNLVAMQINRTKYNKFVL